MTTYTLTNADFVVRDEDGAYIPFDPGNTAYREYLAWLAEGNIPNPYVQPSPAVPQQVPMWAVRTVLQTAGLFDQTQLAINASTNIALKNIWEYGNFADRGSAAINSLASQLQLTSEQVDQLFRDADALNI